MALQSEMRLACNFCDDMDEAHTPVLPIGSLKCTHRLSPACTAHKNLVPRAELAAQHAAAHPSPSDDATSDQRHFLAVVAGAAAGTSDFLNSRRSGPRAAAARATLFSCPAWGGLGGCIWLL